MQLELTYTESAHRGRLVGTIDDPWFVVADLCEAIGHTDPSAAVANLDPDEKGPREVRTLGGPQQLLCVSESGMYTLLIRSNKPAARPFRRWVTREVLPSIRKHGCYPPPTGAVTRRTPAESELTSRQAMRHLAVANSGLRAQTALGGGSDDRTACLWHWRQASALMGRPVKPAASEMDEPELAALDDRRQLRLWPEVHPTTVAPADDEPEPGPRTGDDDEEPIHDPDAEDTLREPTESELTRPISHANGRAPRVVLSPD